MKLRCDIKLPKDYTPAQKFEAMARAARDESMWHEVYSKKEIGKRTCLDNKCGSCMHFCPFDNSSKGTCEARPYCAGRDRSRPKCSKYIRNPYVNERV